MTAEAACSRWPRSSGRRQSRPARRELRSCWDRARPSLRSASAGVAAHTAHSCTRVARHYCMMSIASCAVTHSQLPHPRNTSYICITLCHPTCCAVCKAWPPPSAARLAARPGYGKRSCSSAPARHARRFSGAQPLARPAEAAGDAGDPRAAEPALTPGDLDGELLQHLRRLSKRDPVTKLKALQARGAWRHRAGTPLLGGRKQAAPGKGLEGAAPLSWPVVLFACALVGAPIRRVQRALLRVAGRINHHGCLQLQAHTLGALLLEHTAARLLLHLTGGRNGRGW